jgi:hypothetical protein
VVDVLDRDRAPLRRDPAGEPLPERDADAALDLLLEALRGPRDELAGLVNKDRRRIRLEESTDPVEELVEELVERAVRERGLGDRLEIV